MDLLLVHLSEGGEKLLEMLWRGLIAVCDFGAVYKGHFIVSLGPPRKAVEGGRRTFRLEKEFGGSPGWWWSSFAKNKWRKVSSSAFQRSFASFKHS